MNPNLHRSCPICNYSQFKKLHSQTFSLPDGHPLTNGYNVVCCNNCGFVFADTTVSQQDYDVFYSRYSIYEDSKTSSGAGLSPWDSQRLEDMARKISQFLPDFNARILDIGCANGGLLKAFKSLGYTNLTGIDPSPACVANTTKETGAHAFIGTLPNLPLDIGTFDCVILSHVLEHVHELLPSVKAIEKLVASFGLLYIEVPNADRYQDFVFSPFQDFNTEHINHFSITCLLNLFIGTSLRSIEIGEKIVFSSPNMPYPAIYSFFSKESQPDLGKKLNQDMILCSHIEEFISRSSLMMKKIDSILQEAINKSPEVIVWGTGQLAMKLLVESCLSKAKIIAFVDGNPINQGKVLKGVPVRAPSDIAHLDYPIIITSTLHQIEIAGNIGKMGLKNKIIFLS